MVPQPLHHQRILVVEDDGLLALGYEALVEAAGAETVGPAATVEEAGKLAETNRITAALLDIRLADGEVWPLAQTLALKGVPFAFCTGYLDRASVAANWPGRPILSKPTTAAQIVSVLAEMLKAEY